MILPMQPVFEDEHGTLRFRANPLVRHLLEEHYTTEHGLPEPDAEALAQVEATHEERAQFAQLIGCSLGGYVELSYVPEDDPALVAYYSERALPTEGRPFWLRLQSVKSDRWSAPVGIRLRGLLKAALRRYGFRVEAIKSIPEYAAQATQEEQEGAS